MHLYLTIWSVTLLQRSNTFGEIKMKLLAALLLSAVASPTFAASQPQWSGDCCNASGMCMVATVSPTQLRLVGDGRSGSVDRTINVLTVAQTKGSWKYGPISWSSPTNKKDGVLELEDGRQFTCFRT